MPQENKEGVDALKFPVLCFSQDIVYVKATLEHLTICGKGALTNGYFMNLLIIDANSMGYKVNGAKKLYGVGRFWGYNLFLNQRIKVELLFSGSPFHVSMDEIKVRILESFKKWHGWASGGNLLELRDQVKQAQSIAELSKILCDPVLTGSSQ